MTDTGHDGRFVGIGQSIGGFTLLIKRVECVVQRLLTVVFHQLSSAVGSLLLKKGPGIAQTGFDGFPVVTGDLRYLLQAEAFFLQDKGFAL